MTDPRADVNSDTDPDGPPTAITEAEVFACLGPETASAADGNSAGGCMSDAALLSCDWGARQGVRAKAWEDTDSTPVGTNCPTVTPGTGQKRG